MSAAIELEQARNDVVRDGQNQSGLPAEDGRRVAHRSYGMAAIMLAVAPGAHAVFPCFAPVDRTDANKNTFAPKYFGPSRIIDDGALLEDMIATQIVIETCGQTVQLRTYEIALGRMQISARGVAA